MSLLFVFGKTVKNRILETARNPGRLVLYLVVAALFASGIIGSLGSNIEAEDLGFSANIAILHGVYYLLLLFVGVFIVGTALKSGVSLFTMSDVNLLFVSPISSKSILVFGLLKQMGILSIMFIICMIYGGLLRSLFAVTASQAIILIAGIIVFALCCQLFAISVYSFSNSDTGRILLIRSLLYACAAAVVLIIGVQIVLNGFSLNSLYIALRSPAAEFVPLFGWAKGLVFALISGNTLRAVIFSALMLATVALSVGYFGFSRPDYYEDALQNAESTYEMRQAMKQNKMVDKRDFANGRRIKVSSTGIGAGAGASVFFFKHLREIRRRSRLMFINIFSFVQLAVSMFIAVFITNFDDGEPVPAFYILVGILALGIYFQMFFSAAGEWGRELLKPYIYLAPDSPLKKLFFASLTSVIKPLFDGVLTFAAVGIYLHASAPDIIMCILAYSSCGAIFAGANILSEWIIGSSGVRVLNMLLYILISLAAIIPAIFLCVLAGIFTNAISAVLLIPLILWNIAASFVLFLLSKNTINNMETNL